MSKELTEQWRNGTLECGEYYLKYTDGTTDREYLDWANVYGVVSEKGFSTEPCDIEEVLDPVPTYEEWVKIGTWYTEKSHNELLKKIEKLEMQRESDRMAVEEGAELVAELEDRLKEAEEVIKFYANADGLTNQEKQMTAEKYHLVYGLKANDYLEKYGVEK